MQRFSVSIIKYIPLQQGLRHSEKNVKCCDIGIIKYMPLQQGLRR